MTLARPNPQRLIEMGVNKSLILHEPFLFGGFHGSEKSTESIQRDITISMTMPSARSA
jgi:hypothetical protein